MIMMHNSSWGAVIVTHIQQAMAEKIGHQNSEYEKFAKPGFPYARFPLCASPIQIRESNHIMLEQGNCYLRLFPVKYRRQITACLGKNPTFSRVEEQRGAYTTFYRGDLFVTAYISGPFQAHIAISRKGNPFFLGTLRCLNDDRPTKIGPGGMAEYPASTTRC